MAPRHRRRRGGTGRERRNGAQASARQQEESSGDEQAPADPGEEAFDENEDANSADWVMGWATEKGGETQIGAVDQREGPILIHWSQQAKEQSEDQSADQGEQP